MGIINIVDVGPDMVLAADVKDRHGHVLLRETETIAEKHVKIFKMWAVTELDVKGVDQEVIESRAAEEFAPALLQAAERIAQERFRHADSDDPVVRETPPVIAPPPAFPPAGPGGTVSAADADARIDWKRLEHLEDLSRKKDPTMFTDLMRMFLVDAPARIARMKEAMKGGDPEAMFLAAHSLKGLSGSLGMTSMVGLCESLQMMGHDKVLTGAESFVDRLEGEFSRIGPLLENAYLLKENQK